MLSTLVAIGRSSALAGRAASTLLGSRAPSLYPSSPSLCAAFSTQTGMVKWFDVKKGYGFIVTDDGSPDVFVHQSVIHAEGFRSLAEGERVEFTVTSDMDGRVRAEIVTGPGGAVVKGAPRPSSFNSPRSSRFGGMDGGHNDRYGSGSSNRRTSRWSDDDDDDVYGARSSSFGGGHPSDQDFRELDLPENEIDDNDKDDDKNAANPKY